MIKPAMLSAVKPVKIKAIDQIKKLMMFMARTPLLRVRYYSMTGGPLSSPGVKLLVKDSSSVQFV